MGFFCASRQERIHDSSVERMVVFRCVADQDNVIVETVWRWTASFHHRIPKRHVEQRVDVPVLESLEQILDVHMPQVVEEVVDVLVP